MKENALESNQIKIWTDNIESYSLLDSGDRQKLEKIGDIIIIRSEPRALWKQTLPISEWKKAVAVYGREDRGNWVFRQQIPEEFNIDVSNLKASIKFTKTSKHIGIFPEQSAQWDWIQKTIKNEKRKISVLNLFGYTGLATLAAAQAGAEVTHVDASKTTINWARQNQVLSGLENAPIRWILDDAIKFVKREFNRGKKYDAIIMDPPAFGRGPQGQVWKIEENLIDLLNSCKQILSDNPLFVILTTYAVELSSLSLANLLKNLMTNHEGTIQSGEFAIKQINSNVLLPLSIVAIWHNKKSI